MQKYCNNCNSELRLNDSHQQYVKKYSSTNKEIITFLHHRIKKNINKFSKFISIYPLKISIFMNETFSSHFFLLWLPNKQICQKQIFSLHFYKSVKTFEKRSELNQIERRLLMSLMIIIHFSLVLFYIHERESL